MPNQVRQIITIYCLCDDFLRAWGHKDAPQAKMTTAEVMTVSLVAAVLFSGNQERSRCFLKEHGYIKNMLCKGNFTRRLHEIPEAVWQAFFDLLAKVHQQSNEAQEYAVDSLPVEVMLAPGSEADISAFRRLRLGLPEKARIFADAGYLDQHEEALLDDAGLHLVAQRRSNSRAPLAPWVSYIVRHERKRIETVFSQIAGAFGRTLHAVTPKGFELKVFLTVLAYAITAQL